VAIPREAWVEHWLVPAVRAGVSRCGARLETLLRGTTHWCVEILERVHQGSMIEIGDVTKARPERLTPRPLRRRLQWTAPLNPLNQIITTLFKITTLWPGTSLIRREVRV